MSCFGEKPKECVCKIFLLDDTSYNLVCKANTKGEQILNKVYEHLNLLEKDYFGLRYLDNSSQTHWLDPLKSLRSQFRDSPSPYSLYFGVKFYATDPCKLHEEITRYQFFLQVKKDVLQGRLPVTFDTSAELGAYAVQSELGDFEPKRHSYGYVSELRFVPNQTVELEDRIMQIHKSLAGQVPSVAEFMYLDKAKWLDMYGVDLHPVQGEGSIEYFLGLTPTGIVVYKNKTRVGNYFWPRIVKITFKTKTFMIRVRDKNNEENTYAFELASKSACKHLWKCCVEHHAFFRLSQVNENTSGAGKVFSFGSKYRYSGRTEKEAQSSDHSHGRRQPQVIRTPSKRYERRASVEKKKKENVTRDAPKSPEKLPVVSPQAVDVAVTQTPKTKRLSGYLASPESPTTSCRSTPWTASQTPKGGLYTSGRDSPLSTRSEKMKFPNHRSRTKSANESEGESRRRSHSRKYSDNESEASTVLRHKHRRGYDSGSETDTRRSQRLRGRQRKSGAGSDWRRSDYNKENGSVISGHGSDAGQVQRRRRRRSRSRSPGKKLPQELQNHIKYDLVEASGLTEDQMRDIPFTNVQTDKANLWTGKYSPYARQRRRSPARRRSFGSEASSNFNNSRNHGNSNSYVQDELIIQPPQVIKKQEFQTANTVKTKPLPTYIGTCVPPDAQPNPYTAVNGYADKAKNHIQSSPLPARA